jgi:hypothetical protein
MRRLREPENAKQRDDPLLHALRACVALAIVATNAACNPTFNWREFRSADGYAVMLPGRPQTVSREVKLPDATVQMSMTSTGVGATLFAVGMAQLPAGLSGEPTARRRTIAHVRDALVRNVNVSQVAPSAAVSPILSGARVSESEAIDATGRDSSGRTVLLAARLFVVDDRLFQLIAIGTKDAIPAEALDTFFTSFRLIQ